jgi:hypothetical protein
MNIEGTSNDLLKSANRQRYCKHSACLSVRALTADVYNMTLQAVVGWPACEALFGLHTSLGMVQGRCFKPVDLALEQQPKLVAVDEESDDQIVHAFRLGKADRTAH